MMSQKWPSAAVGPILGNVSARNSILYQQISHYTIYNMFLLQNQVFRPIIFRIMKQFCIRQSHTEKLHSLQSSLAMLSQIQDPSNIVILWFMPVMVSSCTVVLPNIAKMLRLYHSKSRNCYWTIPNTVLPRAQLSPVELPVYLNVSSHLWTCRFCFFCLGTHSSPKLPCFWKLKMINLPDENYVCSWYIHIDICVNIQGLEKIGRHSFLWCVLY